MHNTVLRNNALESNSRALNTVNKIVYVLLALIWLEILWVEGVLTALIFLPMFVFAELSFAVGDSNGLIAGALGVVSVASLIILSFLKPRKMVFVLFIFASFELWNCILNAPVKAWTDSYFIGWPIISMALCVCIFLMHRVYQPMASEKQSKCGSPQSSH